MRTNVVFIGTKENKLKGKNRKSGKQLLLSERIRNICFSVLITIIKNNFVQC